MRGGEGLYGRPRPVPSAHIHVEPNPSPQERPTIKAPHPRIPENHRFLLFYTNTTATYATSATNSHQRSQEE